MTETIIEGEMSFMATHLANPWCKDSDVVDAHHNLQQEPQQQDGGIHPTKVL